ncbi:uncharacterized protein METZ01_LOCUS254940, partial [marine metagenome]
MRYIGLTAVLLLAACGGDSTTAPTTPPTPVATSITLSATSLSFASLGEAQQLTATVKDQNGATMSGAFVTWTSSNTAIATVLGNGLVTAISVGSANVLVQSGAVSAMASVTVAQTAASITLAPTNLIMTPVGDTATFVPTVKDAGGSTIVGATVMWTTSSSSVATISSAGTVTSGANGTATITATSESASATATVTVQDPLQITTTSLPGVMVHSSYDQTLAAFGGDSPYTWSVITGSLPNGLSLSPANGQITGTATTVGSSTFTLQVRSTDGQTVSKEFTVSVYAALIITTASVPNAITGNEYSVSFGA